METTFSSTSSALRRSHHDGGKSEVQETVPQGSKKSQAQQIYSETDLPHSWLWGWKVQGDDCAARAVGGRGWAPKGLLSRMLRLQGLSAGMLCSSLPFRKDSWLLGGKCMEGLQL